MSLLPAPTIYSSSTMAVSRACLCLSLLVLLDNVSAVSTSVAVDDASSRSSALDGDEVDEAPSAEAVMAQMTHQGNPLLPQDMARLSNQPPPLLHPHRNLYPHILPPSSSSSSSSSILYQLLQSQAEALRHQQGQATTQYDNNINNKDNIKNNDDDDDDDDDEEEEDDDKNNNNNDNDSNGDNGGGREKRVFCNGFTGCGGRHRSASRWRRRRVLAARKRLIPVLVKRPVCTSRECLHDPSGATRPDALGTKASFLRRQLSSALRSRGRGVGLREVFRLSTPLQPTALASILQAAALASAVRGEGGGSRVGPGTSASGGSPSAEAGKKRLFCNSYGGCRGKKRSLFSPWMSRMNSVADSLRRR